MKFRSILLCLNLFLSVSNFLAQQYNADSLRTLLNSQKSDTNKADNYSRMILAYSENGETATALRYADSAYLLASKLNFKKGMGNSLSLKGKLLLKTGEMELALKTLEEALEVRKLHGNKQFVCSSLYDIATWYKASGDPENCLKYYKEGLSLAEQIKNEKMIASGEQGIGGTYYRKGDYPTALIHYLRSLKNYEKVKDELNVAVLSSNIGLIYDIQGELDKALDLYIGSLKVYEKHNVFSRIASAYLNIGNIYYAKKDFEKSLDYYLRAKEISEKEQNRQMLSSLYNNLGNIYVEQKKFQEGYDYFKKSLEIREKIHDEYGIAESYHQIATVLYRQRKLNEALPYSLKALDLSKALNERELTKDILQCLSGIYEVKKDGLNSLKYYKEFISTRDSIFNKENTRKTVEARMNFDFEKKEAAAKLEQEKKDLLAIQEKEKEKLIRNSFIGGFTLMIALSFFIYRGYRQKKKSNLEITHQKEIIEEKQKEILDSINYAVRIQQALLAHDDFLMQNLPEHFVYFNPKDIVSGDFYWAASVDSGVGTNDKNESNKLFYLAVCDSTGHGIPGAFMSLLNIGFLSEAINEKHILQPNLIFDHVRRRLIESISNKGQKDGFDGALICVEKNKGSYKVRFAAAHNAILHVSNGIIKELAVDRMPVGHRDEIIPFSLHEVEVKKGDVLYLSTDGYADQFGGPKGKKFKYKQLEDHLLAIHSESMETQKNSLKKTFDDWKGGLEQIDDVCVIGIRF